MSAPAAMWGLLPATWQLLLGEAVIFASPHTHTIPRPRTLHAVLCALAPALCMPLSDCNCTLINLRPIFPMPCRCTATTYGQLQQPTTVMQPGNFLPCTAPDGSTNVPAGCYSFLWQDGCSNAGAPVNLWRGWFAQVSASNDPSTYNTSKGKPVMAEHRQRA